MKKKIFALAIAAVLAMALLVGCGGDATANAPETLEGTTWETVTMVREGQSYDMEEMLKSGAAAYSIKVEFKDGKAIAHFGDEKSESDYTYEDGTLTIQGQTIQVGEKELTLSMEGVTLVMQKK